jgi:hypothetical protein
MEDGLFRRWVRFEIHLSVRRASESFFSITRWGSVTMSFPDIITISSAGSMRCLIWRKTSRILRFTLFRATAFPIFFEAIIPSLFLLPNPLGMEKIIHNLSTRFFLPSSMTFLNSGRLARRSFFLKEKSSIHWRGIKERLHIKQLFVRKIKILQIASFSAIKPSSVFYLFAYGLPIRVFLLLWSFVCESRAHVFF